MELTHPAISVVVTTYSLDRLSNVKALVDSLSAQTCPDLELVFVGENDRQLCHKVACHAYSRGIRGITVLFNDGDPGASPARNLGITRARGDFVAFLDDSVEAHPTWAEEILNTYGMAEDVVGVAGVAEPDWEEPSMASLPEELHWLVSCTGFLDTQAIRESAHGATVNVSYRREAFAVAGLFSPHLGPNRSQHGRRPRRKEGSEDQEFSRRVLRASAKKILFNPAVRVRRKVYKFQLTPRFVAQRACATGWSRRMLKHRYGSEDKTLGDEQAKLLHRVLTRLLPAILVRFFVHPVKAWWQLRITVVAVAFAALGYVSFSFGSRLAADEQVNGSQRLEHG